MIKRLVLVASVCLTALLISSCGGGGAFVEFDGTGAGGSDSGLENQKARAMATRKRRPRVRLVEGPKI